MPTQRPINIVLRAHNNRLLVLLGLGSYRHCDLRSRLQTRRVTAVNRQRACCPRARRARAPDGDDRGRQHGVGAAASGRERDAEAEGVVVHRTHVNFRLQVGSALGGQPVLDLERGSFQIEGLRQQRASHCTGVAAQVLQ